MHAVLIANAEYLDDELPEFGQLCVGLVDEQVQITRVVPARCVQVARRPVPGLNRREADVSSGRREAAAARKWEAAERRTPGPAHGPLADTPLFGRRLTWESSAYGAINHRRLVRLGAELATPVGGAAPLSVNVIHALHRGVWSAAATLGEQLDAAVVFRAAAWEDAEAAARLARQLQPTRCVMVAAGAPLAAELRRRTDNLVRVETVFPGVHVRTPHPGGRAPGSPVCVAVCGDGVLDDSYHAVLGGIARAVQRRPGAQFFFDTPRIDPHRLWREAGRRGLLPHLSFVPRSAGHRDLLLMADALVLPQPAGRTRGLTLQAMARALPVIAAGDPALDELTPDHTAWVLERPDEEAWAEALGRLIEFPDEAADLGLRARAWVHEERLASDQVGRLLNVYRTMTGEPIGFVGG